MIDITIVRRRGLGFGSARGLIDTWRDIGITASEWRTWCENTPTPATHYLRWGCTADIPNRERSKVLNKASAIHRVNNKGSFARVLEDNGLGPRAFFNINELETFYEVSDEPVPSRFIHRPHRHSRGRCMTVFNYVGLLPRLGEGYIRPLIDKEAEYRVYVVCGKAVSVARKTPPEDETQIAWNHALGCEFTNVRWDDWDTRMVGAAIAAARLSGLEYAAVDMMVERGTSVPYTIEINSAGSLPPNEDGTPSYRARCVARGLAWHIFNCDFTLLSSNEGEGWRRYIHPVIWSRHPLNSGSLLTL